MHEQGPSSEAGLAGRVERIAQSELAPLITDIDRAGLYPESVLRALGAAGAFAALASAVNPEAEASDSLNAAIESIARIGQECVSTSFCAWCHCAFVWYLANTENAALRDRLLKSAAAGQTLGGTGLSNPLKALAKIEPLRLHGRRTAGGFIVNGQLPQVSNLGPEHHFGTVFEAEDGSHVAAIVDCAAPGVVLTAKAGFLALNGTRTFSVRFHDASISDANILAEPAEPFLARIRPGFMLMQCAIALGLTSACIEIMQMADQTLGHVNEFLPERPAHFRESLDHLWGEVAVLSRTPLDTGAAYQRRVLKVRLTAGELSLRAAQAAMLHMGAKGYLVGSAAERRLREAFFIGIVTPATKDLRRELASTT